MAIGITDDKHYQAIADKIRYYDSMYEDGMKPEEMPDAIDWACESSFYDGWDNGYGYGHEEGLDDGYDEGVNTAYHTFWDDFQDNGERTDYQAGFAGQGWSDELFKPKYIIKPKICSYMFYKSGIKNLKKCLDDAGVYIDFSNSNIITFYWMFSNSSITHCPTIGNKYVANLTNLFQQCKDLVQVDYIQVKPNVEITCSNAFTNCSKLEYVEFSHNFRPKSLNLSPCNKLSHTAILYLFNSLDDLGSSKSSITLGATNLNKMTDAEKAIATEKGWTLA